MLLIVTETLQVRSSIAAVVPLYLELMIRYGSTHEAYDDYLSLYGSPALKALARH